MFLKIITLSILWIVLCDATLYDRYTGDMISDYQLARYEKKGVTNTCTIKIAICDASERRRVDGSCNSLDHPIKGTFYEPLRRVLPAHFYNGSYPRKSVDGSDLGLPRIIRKTLLREEKSTNYDFTQSITGYTIFAFGDIASITDLEFVLINKTDCCTEKGKDADCAPNIIPEDDPLHKSSGISCMNLTRPRVFSDYGCTHDNTKTVGERATGVFDLSNLYNLNEEGDKVIRSFVSGKLSVDIDESGIVWPPNGDGLCMANQPEETRCFKNYGPILLSSMLITIWYIRQHNYFASQLASVNLCWDDETLFQTARDMNIAFAAQVYFYECLATLIGRENLIKQGILSNRPGHRDIYNHSTYPTVTLEYVYIFRWFHTCQEGTANMYYPDGTFMKEYPYVNITFRPGFLAIDQNIVYLTQQMFRQSAAKIDYGVDPDLTENGIPYLQRSVDILTSDLHKSRLFGFAPYIDYVHFCTGHKITNFPDLAPHMELERIEKMKQVYKYVQDIDLIAGIWAEKLLKGGSIPATLACLITENVKQAIQSDRHWYERSQRPYAFTEKQLLEMRKATLALLICNNADNVTHVQRQAFLNISPHNPLTACTDILNIDFTAWSDDNCGST